MSFSTIIFPISSLRTLPNFESIGSNLLACTSRLLPPSIENHTLRPKVLRPEDSVSFKGVKSSGADF